MSKVELLYIGAYLVAGASLAITDWPKIYAGSLLHRCIAVAILSNVLLNCLATSITEFSIAMYSDGWKIVMSLYIACDFVTAVSCLVVCLFLNAEAYRIRCQALCGGENDLWKAIFQVLYRIIVLIKCVNFFGYQHC